MQQFSNRYYKLLSRLFKMHKHAQLVSIDFNKPWWYLFKKQGRSIVIVATLEGFNNIFLAMPALILDYFLSQKISYFGYFMLLWFFILLLELIADFHSTKTMVQCLQSVHYAANQHLLQVDPIFHQSSTKGKVLAKIYRGAEAYQELFRAGIYELLPMIVGVATVVISFVMIDYTLGLIALGLLTTLSLVSIAIFLFSAKILVPMRIDADDKAKNIGTESLMQVSLIRSTFSADQMDTKLKNINKKRLFLEGNALRSYDIISSFTKFAYVVIFACVGFYIIRLVGTNVISHATGIALLVTFFSGTYQLLTVGQFIYRFKDQLVRVSDLFEFMRSYGQQTFPVMQQQVVKEVFAKKTASASEMFGLEARAIKFRYDQNEYVFNGHNLHLSVAQNQSSKLYGIIGYSGQGKSTLLSVLGGQLKPQSGTVKINGVNIYTIDDEMRRSLITLQNQSSTGFYGSIRYNLTFGLLRNHRCSDQELVELLQRVGLWDVLQHKRGLATKVSEGGLALSSGQRQRLDFASLYLRACYYNPAFILLDEPTSNLDEQNEQNIIAMIQELAQRAVVLVVSHRVRTLEKTQGILDLSLTNVKNLAFMHTTELAQKSPYYRQLLAGTISGVLSKKSDLCEIDLQQTFDVVN